jgi:hypothetical protein
MIQRILILLFIVITNTLYSQVDTISISGMYYGTNVYVYNPSVADSFSIQKIIVNKDTISEELTTNGIEIDLGSYNLDEGARVNIMVLYKSSFAPVIVNPEALMPPIKFRISKPVYTKNDELQWQVRGVPGDYPIVVEQYKWNQWKNVAEVDPIDTVANNIYKIPIRPHSGKNIYRVKSINIKGEEVRSRDLIFNASNHVSIYIQNKKFTDEITLSAKTEYEIYDMESNLLLSGYDRYIKIDKLPKGKYLLFFDNQIQEFKKK